MKNLTNKFLMACLSASCLITTNLPLKAMYDELKNEERVVHYFTPPQLEEENKGEKIYCVRPMYNESLDISSQRIRDKHIVNISGFGGSGITLGEGAVDNQLEQFEKNILPILSHKQQEEITVIGAGWIGSLVALKLADKGYKNLQLVTQSMDNLTSHNAGGLIAPVSMANSPEYQKLADKFGIDAYVAYKAALEGKHPFIQNIDRDIVKVPTYFGDRKTSGLEPYVEAGVMRSAIDVTLQILDRNVSHKLVCYEDGIFVNTPSVLSQFHNQIKHEYQIPIIQREVKSFDEISSKVIFNCAGVNAANFKGREEFKKKYIPTLGHLIMVKNQEASEKTLGLHNSMILTYGNVSTTSEGLQCTDSLYAFPKHYGPYNFVLGGTFIENVKLDAHGKLCSEHSYPEKHDLIWENTRKFFGTAPQS